MDFFAAAPPPEPHDRRTGGPEMTSPDDSKILLPAHYVSRLV